MSRDQSKAQPPDDSSSSADKVFYQELARIEIDPPPSRAHKDPPYLGESLSDSHFSDNSDMESDSDQGLVVRTPYQLAQNRIDEWPRVKSKYNSDAPFQVYQEVRKTGLPNMLGARREVKSLLKYSIWKQTATGHQNDSFILDGIKYGFPIQYMGPPLNRENKFAHASATNYMSHIQKYVDLETSNNAMLGPFPESPFIEWLNISPLMTRPKSESAKHRVIVDLSYPCGNNVNSYVGKNTVFGSVLEHRLPTIDDSVKAIQAKGYNVLLASINVERAYRNVPSCPLDYPLLGIKVAGQVYIDIAMPFGSRVSSLYMQMLADHIVRALDRIGITAQMYIDDMIMQLTPGQDPHARFAEVIALYRALGLPVAYSKIQAPAPQIIHLGISIDVSDRVLSIPVSKIQKFIELVRWALGQEYLSMRVVQRIVGKINYLSRCVSPARMFMGRILQALRIAAKENTRISVSEMRSDLHWFLTFLVKYNGRSMMKTGAPTKVILADSCLTGGGATDMTRCYTLVYTTAIASTHHISTLEALNCLVACRTLISSRDRHTTIELNSDNRASIDAMAFGRAKDPVLAAICRAIWYLAARMDIKMVYTHTPGEQMSIPDALSRAHLNASEENRAQQIIAHYNLKTVVPQKFATNYKNFL